MENISQSLFLKPAECAVLLAVSPRKMYELIASGQIPGVRRFGASIRISRVAIEKLAADAAGLPSTGGHAA